MTFVGQAKRPPRYVIHQLLWQAADWLYPPVCGGCDAPGERWCAKCQEQTVLLENMAICPRCGVPNHGGGICADCAAQPPPYTALRSWAVYAGALRKAIHRLKYQGDLGLGEALGAKLFAMWQSLDWQVEMIIPIPLSAQRKRERGYNQSSLLARPLSLATRLPLCALALRRTRDTASQVKLTGSERRQNVRGAFTADARQVAGRAVLLIDDVATTGATMLAAGEALQAAGAHNIYALTLARAGLTNHPDSLTG